MVGTRSTSQVPREDTLRQDLIPPNQQEPGSGPPLEEEVIVEDETHMETDQTQAPEEPFDANSEIRTMKHTLASMMRRIDQTDNRVELAHKDGMERLRQFQEQILEQLQNLHTVSRPQEKSDPNEEQSRNRQEEPREETRITREVIPGREETVDSRERKAESRDNEKDKSMTQDGSKGRQPQSTVPLDKNPKPGEYQRKFGEGKHNASPFTDDIAKAPFPKKLNLNFLSKYNGKTDPEEHVTNFETDVYVRQIGEPLMTRLFATTLQGPAQKWFQTLPPKSVKNFGVLAYKFISYFATSKKQPKSVMTLGSVKQQPGETLQKYLERFKEAQLQVPDLKEDVHLHLLEAGLNVEARLARSLAKDPVQTLEQFTARSKRYLDLEQIERLHAPTSERRRSPPPASKEKNGNSSRSRQTDTRPSKGRREGKYDNYTPLNVSRSRLWKEVALTEMKHVDRPTFRPRSGLDKSRYCSFHKGPGHTTDECYELRDCIEAQLREGKLRQYVLETIHKGGNKRTERSPGRRQKDQDSKHRKTEKSDSEFTRADFECSVISGALGGGGDTGSQRRKYLREILSVRTYPKFKEDNIQTRRPRITFTEDDLKDVAEGHEDGLVISANLLNCRVKKIFIDAGSSADIIMWGAFQRMNLEVQNLKPCKTSLIGFNGEHTAPKGYIDLKLTLGTEQAFKSDRVRFIVADFPSPYNVILGRPTLHKWDILFSTKHQKLRFLNAKSEIVTVNGDQKESRQCYFDTVREDGKMPPSSPRAHQPGVDKGKRKHQGNPVNVVELDLRDDLSQERPEPEGELENFVIGPNPDHTTKIGQAMGPDNRPALETFLEENQDVFAWSSAEIPGVDPGFCCHKLAMSPDSIPVAQKKRKLGPERKQALSEHVQELHEAGFIREIQYTTWLSNVVMVKKPNGKWRVCTDYTDLNKVCPKDSYPMPVIDQLVDNSAGFRVLSFMDAYSGYNQIAMHPDDQDKTAFMTDTANFCYNVMPFGLKNAGATYQRMMNRVFSDQIGKNIEVYIDDMIVKSANPTDHLRDLEQTFSKLRQYNIRLNPAKCAFGVPAGKFLGFLLTHRGIEVNPDKCKAVLDMKVPTTKKEVQQLTGRLAALQRFLPKSAENALPIFRLLKKEAQDGWNAECDLAFQRIKECLAAPPVLSKPEAGEKLILYLAVGEEAVSAALVREPGKDQEPIYFVSRTLQGAEVRYQKLEKVAFALLVAARKLRHYFQAHSIAVRTGQPIRQILHKPDLAGRMTSWAIELSEFDITYEARHAIKSQALADFVMELTSAGNNETDPQQWKVYVDGSSNTKGSGAGAIIESPDGVSIEHSLRLAFPTSNNQAEYEAVLAGLAQAKEHGAKQVQVYTDSQLVASQIDGTYQVKGALLIKYLAKVREAMAGFERVRVTHIPRTDNTRADILSKLASTRNPSNHRTIVQQNLLVPACVLMITTLTDWRKPIIDYLDRGILPDDTVEARKLVREAAMYAILDDQLYRRGLHSPMLKCLDSDESEYVLKEIHEGINGQHMGATALSRKALRAGYFWPTMKADAEEHVRSCDSCQKHAKIIWASPTELQSITAPWPFFKWGMDLLGPFKSAPGQYRWLIVAVDYFTKWIEADPLTSITAARIQTFFKRSIVSRFGIPAEVVTDNGTQFIDKGFRALMAEFHITHHFASVEHPQSNGQAEAANKIILDGLRKRMAEAESNWVEQLYAVLWGYRTSTQSATKETPFRLTYGCEAMIPVELGEPSWRTTQIIQEGERHNQEALAIELDTIEEVRLMAHCRDVAAKQLISAQFNRKVRPREFSQGDLVLRRADIGNKNARDGKLAANWEGPYRVTKALGKGAYTLETLAQKSLKRTWNADKLKEYYS